MLWPDGPLRPVCRLYVHVPTSTFFSNEVRSTVTVAVVIMAGNLNNSGRSRGTQRAGVGRFRWMLYWRKRLKVGYFLLQ